MEDLEVHAGRRLPARCELAICLLFPSPLRLPGSLKFRWERAGTAPEVFNFVFKALGLLLSSLLTLPSLPPPGCPGGDGSIPSPASWPSGPR